MPAQFRLVFNGGNPDDRPRRPRRHPEGPARQWPAAPPGSRVPRRPPRTVQDRRDRQGPRPVGRRGRQRADHPRRQWRGRPRTRQAGQLPGELLDRRRSRRHHAQGTPSAQARPRPRARPRRASPLACPQAGLYPQAGCCGRPGHPPERAGLPAEVAGRHAGRRCPAPAPRRRSAGPAVRAARDREDLADRGGLPRPDHRGRRRRHHRRRPGRRVHPEPRRHLHLHLRAAHQGHAGGAGPVHRRRHPHLAGGAGGRLPRDGRPPRDHRQGPQRRDRSRQPTAST